MNSFRVLAQTRLLHPIEFGSVARVCARQISDEFAFYNVVRGTVAPTTRANRRVIDRTNNEQGVEMNSLVLVILAGLLAVVYGVVQTGALLRAPAGNAKMQEIAAAIQEGAQAYLLRQ